MISLRLKSLVKYINKTDKIIDIGCDHALLDIYLIKEKYIDKIIVSDIHEYALASGKNNIKKYNLIDKISIRLGDGLSVLTEKDDVDTIIISGMGTYTILDILKNKYLRKINKLIIQSNRDYDILRKEIIKLGFYIEAEEAVEDNNKFYINIVFLRGKKTYNKSELKYGTKNMINKNAYYNYLINKNLIILTKIEDKKYKRTFQKEINELKELLDD